MPRRRRVIDQALLEPALRAAPDETLAELRTFGDVMIHEVIDRVDTLDAKAQNMIGWTSASLALLIAATPAGWPGTFARWQIGVIVIGLFSGLAAIAAGVVALWLVDLHWPSQQDWFCEELFDSPTRLRAYHLLALLDTHEMHSEAAARKARLVSIGQRSLAVAALCAGVVLLVPAVARWLSG
jgi:hypothetical protein